MNGRNYELAEGSSDTSVPGTYGGPMVKRYISKARSGLCIGVVREEGMYPSLGHSSRR